LSGQTRIRFVLLIGALAVPAVVWSGELTRDQILLRNIKLRMAQNLTRVPNYTCLETINRGTHAPERFVIAVPGKSVPFRRTDVLRLEVAEVSGQELYAHAGEHTFEKKDMIEFGNGGLIGNGMFTLFAHDVFTTSVPIYQFIGEEAMEGRTLIRFDFKVTPLQSGYEVGTPGRRAIVGYHGSFWADPETFDAVRLDLIADEVPHYTGLTDVGNRVDYAQVRIGSADVLLPQGGALQARQVSGWASRNQISFTHCREYGVESLIRFDDPADPADAARGTNYVDLPSGLQLSLRLETPIDAGSAHVGDLVTALVDGDAKHKGTVVVPKDAMVSGRLRRVELHKEGWPYVLVGLELIQIEFDGKQSRFFAELEKVTLPPGAEGPKRVPSKDLPGVGLMSATGNHFRLPKGTRIVWKTLSYEQAAELGK